MADRESTYLLAAIAELLNQIEKEINHRCFVKMTLDGMGNLVLIVSWKPTNKNEVFECREIYPFPDLTLSVMPDSIRVQRFIHMANKCVRQSYDVKGP